MAKQWRIGMIGCGNVVSYGHRPALLALENAELVGLADITAARRKIGQDWFGLSDEQLYADHNTMLAEADVEAVVVTVPQQFRRQIVLDVIAAGKHILSEKPIATNLAEAQELLQAAEDAGLTFGMVHNYHFFPEYAQMKQMVTDGIIGDIRLLVLNGMGVIDYPGAAEYQSDWRHTIAAGGGIMMDMVHLMYLAEWIMGAPAEQVMAFVDAPVYQHRTPQVEDTGIYQIAFPTGFAQVNLGWGEGVGGAHISGATGQIHMRYGKYQTAGFNQAMELYTVKDWQRHEYPIQNRANQDAHIGGSFTQLWSDFLAACEAGHDPIASAKAGYRALQMVLAGYLSGTTGRTIQLPIPTNHPVYRQGIAGMKDVEAWEHSRTAKAGIFGLREE